MVCSFYQHQNVWEKLAVLQSAVQDALNINFECRIVAAPSRSMTVVSAQNLPSKKGLKNREGQARLLHDLASIELQATELALRTLIEFPFAPTAFREELAKLTLSEGQHLRLCLEGIESCGFQWGDWPVHMALWNSTGPDDELIDRILIVHRYLEGSGLDAGDTLLRRLYGIGEDKITGIIKTIVKDEVDHVAFGSHWFRVLCRDFGLDSDHEFISRMQRFRHQVPKRLEPLSQELRVKAGFSQSEIEFLEKLRASMSKFYSPTQSSIDKPHLKEILI